MAEQRKQSYWRLVARQYRRNIPANVALVFLLMLASVAVFAPFLAGDVPVYMKKDGKTYWFPNVFTYKALVSFRFDEWKPAEGDARIRALIPYAPNDDDLYSILKPPSREHWLGTDSTGRDVMSRIIWGARISMTVGFVAMGIAVFIGVIVGALGGFYGKWVDALVLRAIEVMLCFPTLILILALIAFLPPSIYNIMVAVGITRWPDVARLVRGEFLRLRGSDFALAARASGLRDRRIIFRHILPNAMAPVLVSATFGVAGAILIESSLSFLGFGVPPPTASWGEVLKQSQQYVSFAWWLVTFPGVAIFLTVTSFNLVGEGLRDAMDPRLRQ